MIEEIFITQKDVVLVGNPNTYPVNPSYPTHVTDDKQLTQFKKNDVFVSALYTNLDVFFVLEFLEGLCNEIENHTNTLSSSTISEYYFNILDIVNRYHFGICTKSSTGFGLIKSNDVYVDVIETYNVLISNEKVQNKNFIMDDNQDIQVSTGYNINPLLKNEILGYTFIKPNFNDQKTFKLIINKNNLNYISENKFMEKFNKLEIEMDIKNESLEVFRYISKTKNIPPVDLHRENEIYRLTTRDDVTFEHLEIQIPVPLDIKKIKIKNSKGFAFHDEILSVVKWTFKNERVVKADISLEIETFREDECANEVNVKFLISKAENSHLKIEKAVCLGHPSIKVWIKYDICSGSYKIRV